MAKLSNCHDNKKLVTQYKVSHKTVTKATATIRRSAIERCPSLRRETEFMPNSSNFRYVIIRFLSENPRFLHTEFGFFRIF